MTERRFLPAEETTDLLRPAREREAKVMQMFEGTNRIQRMVIGRALDEDTDGTITLTRDLHR